MEIQIEDRAGLNKHRTAAIYGNVPPIARADKSEQYNDVVIKADGWIISVWVNGQLVQHCNTRHHPELKHRNLAGWIGLPAGSEIVSRDSGFPTPNDSRRPAIRSGITG